MGSEVKIYVTGNCQASVLTNLLGAATGLPAEYLEKNNKVALETPHIIFAQPQCRAWLREPAIFFPRIVMPGFHPDLVQSRENGGAKSPLRAYCSSIVLKAWCERIPARETSALFNSGVFEKLGFFEFFEAGKAQLFAEGEAAEFPLETLFARWFAGGSFMHTVNHPKVRAMVDIAELLAQKASLDWKPIGTPEDRQGKGCGWPVYPEIAKRLGIRGEYAFRMHSNDGGRVLDLNEFIERSFDMLAEGEVPREPVSERLKSARYVSLRSTLAPLEKKRHPYVGLPENQYWRKSVHGDVDPVTRSFTITPGMRIATAGSCFAQHISAALKENGFNYFVAETDPGEGGNNYGVFSARFGNIYTPRQLLQLFDRAYGRFRPRSTVWRRGKRFVDPFRPEIEPEAFESAKAVFRARWSHFKAVRHMFEELDVFVFTLGLTEAWRSTDDGAVFPIAPGVAGGVFNPERYEFVNFDVSEIVRDLKDFLAKLRRVNAGARVILTVSPVPLIATYEPRHVLVSTTYSKSALRVAADEIARSTDNVIYFPSYEIIMGSFNRGRYFAEDLRSVTPAGVEHVMRIFFRHFTPDATIADSVRESMEIVCEEESLVRSSPPVVSHAPRPVFSNAPQPDASAVLAPSLLFTWTWPEFLTAALRRMNNRNAGAQRAQSYKLPPTNYGPD